jgi:hypothetical protein
MVEPVRHRQTKEAGTDMFEPKATAPHLDSTDLNLVDAFSCGPNARCYLTSFGYISLSWLKLAHDGLE